MTNEELEREIKRLEEQLTEVRIELLERKANKKPYEVKVPEDIETYYTTDIMGRLQKLGHYNSEMHEHIYKYGEAFEFSLRATLYFKERILLKRMEDWAEEHNGGWTPNWEKSEDKFYIDYHYGSKCFQVKDAWHANAFHKLPYFKSEEIAEQFIEEFRDEIKEVFC